MKGDGKTYVEDYPFTLPNLEDGPTDIGDLWNCHESTYVHGFNLFGKKLTEEHVKVDDIQADDYTLTHVKSSSDKQKRLEVKGEISLELMGGLIKVGGGAEYDKDDLTSLHEEELLCTYDLTTSSIVTLPSVKETINPVVLENILKGVTKATHVVVAKKIGAKVTASIRVRETDSKSKKDIKGHFFGKLILGPVTAAAKVSLGMLDTSAKNDFEKTIKITSRPAINAQPTSIEEMFNIVSSIHTVIKSHVALKTSDKIVYGVPIKFTLVPINQFIEVPVERLYLQFKDTMLETLTGYLTFLKDFQVFRFLHKRILEAESGLKTILYDAESPLTKEISKTEDDFRAKAKKAYTDLGDLLKEYKVGKIDAITIIKTVNEMEKEISMPKVFDHVGNYVQKGRKLLADINKDDIEDGHKVKLFTNELDQQKWYQATKPIKILLRTGGAGISSYSLATIYGLSEKLNNIGINVGVALPNISNNQNSLALKINGEEKLYSTDQSIQHVLQVLKLIVQDAPPIATRFFTIYAAHQGIKLPFIEHLDDLHSLISILKKTETVDIAESYLQSRDLCFKDDSKYKFMINMEAMDSATDSVQKMVFLQHLFGEAIDWVVGKWDFKEIQGQTDSPILFALKNELLVGVCCDTLDTLLLHKSVEALDMDPNSRNNFLHLLQPTKENMERSSFQKRRAQFALNFSSKFQIRSAVVESHQILQDLPGFEMPANDATAALQLVRELVRSALSVDWQGIYTALAKIIMTQTDKAEGILKADFHAEHASDTNELLMALQNVLEKENPFYGLVAASVEGIKAIELDDKKLPVLDKMVEGITKHEQCPETLSQPLNFLKDEANYAERVKKTLQRLENYMSTTNSDPKLESIAKFIRLLKAANEEAREIILNTDILPAIVKQVKISNLEYPGAKTYLDQFIASKNFYGALYILTSVQVHPCLYRTQLAFEKLSAVTQGGNFSSVVDSSGLQQVIDILGKETFSVPQYESLFKNKKFLVLLERVADLPAFLEQVKFSFCQQGIPHYLPDFLRTKLEALVDNPDDGEELKFFKDFEDTLANFRRIASRGTLPDNFAQVLMKTLINNDKLKDIFIQSGALLHWDSDTDTFKQAWNSETVAAAYEKLSEWKRLQDLPMDEGGREGLPLPDIGCSPSPLPVDVEESGPETSRFEKGAIAQQLMGDTLTAILPADFVKLTDILPKPNPLYEFNDGYMAEILPYILQRVKMWGLQTINPDNLSSLIKVITKTSSSTAGKANKFNFVGASSSSTSTSDQIKTKPISKIDVLSCLFARCHPLIFQDILKLISQFSMALPLILRDIKQTDSPKYTCIIPLLKTCTTKWEYTAGVVRYNEMFTSPFKMIVAIRVGTTPPRKPSKSSILNQVLSNRHMFSSASDPGSEHGKALTLDGSVEFCALTPETASPMLWQSAVQPHYATGTEQVLLLANLHGDALDFPETLQILKTFASKFIVFFNSMSQGVLKKTYGELQSQLSESWMDHVYPVLVDPIDKCEELLPGRDPIYTSQLVSDSTSEIVRAVFSDAIRDPDYRVDDNVSFELPVHQQFKSVQYSQEVSTPESQEFIDYVEKLGCQKVKTAMKLQRMDPRTESYQKSVAKTLRKASTLHEIMIKFFKILRLPLKRRLIAMAHLDKQLSILTAEASTKIRNRIMALREEKIRSTSLVRSAESDNLQVLVSTKLMSAFEELDKISLGLEHLYREAGRVYSYYQSCQDYSLERIPQSCGELLVQGNAIEVLDGEVSDMCGPWFDSICHSICEKYPNLRIYVVSIIGLQSSGKSTLLNALFACKFAVSVGRCTRGLFMRILFLEKELVEELGVDAIIVLDTEGLGAPEKLNDENCEQKDRLLATFTMSVSNLTLINVLGESIRDLSDILQIVIITLARLEKANISPDICMVQHLSERDSSKVMQGETEFANALQEAVTLTEKKDMTMGIRNSKSLQHLEQRIKNGDLAKLFPPFKNGATVNAPPSEKYHEAVMDLYKMILDSIKKNKTTQTFHGWHDIIHSYWDAVSKQDYALRFKNIREIQDFIERGTSIANVKSALDDVFRKHREDFQKDLRAKFNEYLNSKKDNKEWEKVKKDFQSKTDQELKKLPNNCPEKCGKCAEAWDQRDALFKSVENKACQFETQDTISKHIQQSRDGILKNLSQMADALVVAHGNCVEFDEIIEQIIQEKLKIKSHYPDDEIAEMVDEIWKRVGQVVSTKLRVEPAIWKVLNEISKEFYANPIVERRVQGDVLPDLSKAEAIDQFALKFWSSIYLDSKQVTSLQSKLDSVPEKVIAKFGSKQFETGMINYAQNLIETILKDFEKKEVKKTFLYDFKGDALVYCLIKFARVMDENDKEWNEKNNPQWILTKKEDEYRKKIKIWLQHGFGYESEGNLIGEKLLTAIRQLAQKNGDEEHVKFVRGHAWLVSSENVRLKYFVELANKVESGDHGPAMDHFRCPKHFITEWFNNKVDSISYETGVAAFKQTADSEFDQTRQAIRNAASAEVLRDLVKDHLTKVEGIEYNPQSTLDFARTTPAEFSLFKNAAVKKLDEEKDKLKLNIVITKPSAQEKIQKILGCSENCGWCGALCWGEFDHHQNLDDTKKHHACHQSEGLVGTYHTSGKHLLSIVCNEVTDDWIVYWYKCEGGMRWGDAKKHPDFVNWIFTRHNQNHFNDLMKWFFVKLHPEISAERDLKPAIHEDLQRHGFLSLPSLSHIVASIECRLGKNKV